MSSSARSPIFQPRTPLVPSFPHFRTHSTPTRRAALCWAPLDGRTYTTYGQVDPSHIRLEVPLSTHANSPSSSASYFGRYLKVSLRFVLSHHLLCTCTRFLLFFSSCSPSRPNKLLCPLFGPAFSQPPDPTYHQCDHPDRLVRNGSVTLDNPKEQFLCRLRTLPIILRHQSSQPYRNIDSTAPMYKLGYILVLS